MKPAPLPDNETERLAALTRTGLLDTPPEPEFDDLVRLAQGVCGVPIALLSLVDRDRLWFKSGVGMSLEQSARDAAFCPHAILSPSDLFVVPDAALDLRFADNPFVTGDPLLRFYAGAPLVTEEGQAIGALCVLDRAPRELTAYQLEALRVIARQVCAQINLRARALLLSEANALLRRTSERLAESERQNRELIDSLPDAVFRVGCDHVVREVRLSASVHDVRTPDALVGKSMRELAPAELSSKVEACIDQAIASGGAPALEYSFQLGGKQVHRESRFSRSGHDEALVIVRDITDRMEVDRMKNEFISTVSHELRTPLTSMRGALGLLVGGAVGELPSGALEMVEIARVSCDRLIRLVNDILDLEKAVAGQVELRREPLEARALIATTLDGLRAMAQQQSVRLHEQSALPWRVVGDADRLVQVLTNLVSNAVKFSPSGTEVSIAVRLGGPGRVRFEVRDQGPGIPPSQTARLFGKFQQLDSSDERAKGGTGLGLAISKALVELHGGEIGVETANGGGAIFWFEVPKAP